MEKEENKKSRKVLLKSERRGKYLRKGSGSGDNPQPRSNDKGVTVDDAIEVMEEMNSAEEIVAYSSSDTRAGVKKYVEARLAEMEELDDPEDEDLEGDEEDPEAEKE